MDKIRVLIVDDMAQVRQGLRTVLPLAGDAAGLWIEVVGEAGDGSEAIRKTGDLHPDVVLMDLAMPVLDGYAATEAIKAQDPSIAVIVLTVQDFESMGKKAHLAGADGFIVKGAPMAEIVEKIRSFEKKEKKR